MTKFLTFFPIGPISNHDEYRGLSPDSTSGVVITTHQNIVYRIQLSSQKTLTSWNSDRKLSHKVVYDNKSQKYVGVFGNVHVRCWEENDENFFQNEKIKLKKPLETIISFNGQYTVLVYKDGTCQSLENFLEVRKSDCIPIVVNENHQMLNVACFNIMDNKAMTYFLRNKQTGLMEFVYFLLDDETLTKKGNVHKIKIARSGSTLSAFTVVEGDVFPSVMTIWSDKRIFMLKIRCDEQTPSDIGSYVAMFDGLKVDKSLSVVSVSKNWIAIYGANDQQEGASLVLYNTLHHYTTIQCKQFFKAHLDNCRLWVIGKFIFIAVGQQLTCAQFEISQELLADIIGSKRSTDFSGTVIKDSLNEESELEECVLFDQEAQLSKSSIQSTSNSLSKSIDLKIQNHQNQPTEPYDKFNNNFRSLLTHNIPIEIVHGKSLLSELIQPITVNDVTDQLYSLEAINLLTGVMEKCGTSESEITERIIPLLIEAKLPHELAICFKKYTTISERMLAKSLKFFIGMDDSPTKLTSINDVLACSFNAALIKEHLRTNLNLDNAIYLLEHIHTELLADESLLSGTELHWFLVIFDSHYQQFILARDPTLNDIIEKWKTSIDTFITNIRDSRYLEAKLHNLVTGKAKPNDNPSSKWYSVEVVKLY